MRAKFAIDGYAIGQPMAQFYYVYSRLGTFQATFLPYVTRATDFNHQPAAFFFYVHQRHARGDSQGATILTWSRSGRDSTNPSTRTSRVVLSSKQGCNTFPTTSAGLRNESKIRLDREEWPAAYADFTALLWGFDAQLNCRARTTRVATVRWRPYGHQAKKIVRVEEFVLSLPLLDQVKIVAPCESPRACR
ncbi:hypothetical protein E4U32_002509 [Claviceps aff. humidiphila group G2b]|nr:hypothetical protein E4U32_002509 [Claviceps aff. humidiphila group G2b]